MVHLLSEVEENRELAAAWQFCSRLAELIKERVGARLEEMIITLCLGNYKAAFWSHLKGRDPCRWRVL